MVRNSNSGHCISRMLQALHLSEPGRHTRFLGLPLRISEEHAVMISRREIRYQVERASKPANVRLFPFPKRGTQHCECTCRNRIKDLNKLSPAPRLKARARTVHLLHDSKRAFPYPLSATFLTKNCFFAMACGEPQPQLLRVMRAQIQNIGGGGHQAHRRSSRGGGNGRRLGLQGVAGEGSVSLRPFGPSRS